VLTPFHSKYDVTNVKRSHLKTPKTVMNSSGCNRSSFLLGLQHLLSLGLGLLQPLLLLLGLLGLLLGLLFADLLLLFLLLLGQLLLLLGPLEHKNDIEKQLFFECTLR
jgi:hypothetical protein